MKCVVSNNEGTAIDTIKFKAQIYCSGVSKLLGAKGFPLRAAYSFCESSLLIHHGVYHDLFVCP